METDFEKKFIEKYSKEEFKDIDKMIEDCLLDKKVKILYGNSWVVIQSVEKINCFQYTHFLSLSKEVDGMNDEEVNLEYENGINNGTMLRNYSLDGSGGESNTKMIRVLDDIEIDWEMINPKVNKKLVKLVFDGNKDEILEIYKKQNYDNYVTGGGTNIIDKHYKEKIQKFNDCGLFWKPIYKKIEVDRNFV